MATPFVDDSHGDSNKVADQQNLDWIGTRSGERSINISGDAFKSTFVSGNNNIVVVYYQSRLEASASDPLAFLPSTLAPNPYRGLLAFQPEDAERFFGREKQVELLWQKFRQLHEESAVGETTRRLLTVLGPSGSGKSSLVRAGLIPELAHRPLPGRERMQIGVVKPDAQPLESLALVLARMATGEGSPVAKTREFAGELKLSNGGRFDGLRRVVKALPRTDASALVVVVDQFEETFSLCKDSAEQTAFIENLLEAASDPGGTVSVVLCLRSDFLGAAQRYPELSRVVAQNNLIIPAMSSEELRQAIECPAKRAGRPLDRATVNLLIDQTGGREGALPLLQFALLRIWEGLVVNKEPGVTLEEIGGIGGSLAGEAERIYNKLDPGDQNIARRLFLGLVQLGEGTKDTRRRIEIAKLVSSQDEPERVRRVIARFCDPGVRLVTLSSSGAGEETAEVTHETIFEHWSLLQEWLSDQRDALSEQRKIEASAEEWKKKGRHSGYLLQGWALKDAERYQKEKAEDLPLSSMTTEFIKKSRNISRSNLHVISLFVAFILVTVSTEFQMQPIRQTQSRKDELLQTVEELKNKKDGSSTAAIIFAIEELVRLKHPFKNFDLRMADLSMAKLSGADFIGTNLTKANLSDADLYDANLSEANLSKANLHDAHVAMGILTKANFSGADLNGANLNGANLMKADLSGTDLSGANLTVALVHEANLSEARLGGANLMGVGLSGANLSGANFKRDQYYGPVRNLTVRQVKSGKNWQSAKFDDDFRKKLFARSTAN